MICTRHELLEAIKKTLAQATPEEKQQLRNALLEALDGSRCDICHESKPSLIFIPRSGRYQCFDCTGRACAEPLIVREPDALTKEDKIFLRSIGVLWSEK